MTKKVKTKGHYIRDIRHYDWYYERGKQLERQRKMAEKSETLTDHKLDMLQRISVLQREVLNLEPEASERDIKNLNRAFDGLTHVYCQTLKVLEE